MKNAFFIAGAVALATSFGASVASAQSMNASGNADLQTKGNVSTKANVNTKANVHANTNVHTRTKTTAHLTGSKSMASANTKTRLHGSHSANFCPPGQAKKPGKGSRFQC